VTGRNKIANFAAERASKKAIPAKMLPLSAGLVFSLH
jgi:hypothetical protein